MFKGNGYLGDRGKGRRWIGMGERYDWVLGRGQIFDKGYRETGKRIWKRINIREKETSSELGGRRKDWTLLEGAIKVGETGES